MIRTYLKVVKAFRTGVCGKDGDNMARQHYGHKKHMNKFTITGIIVLCAVLCFTVLYHKSALDAKCREYKSQISELKKRKKVLMNAKKILKSLRSM